MYGRVAGRMGGWSSVFDRAGRMDIGLVYVIVAGRMGGWLSV